jgi:septum formation protein
MFFRTKFIISTTSESRLSILKKLKLNFVKKKPLCNENYHKKIMRSKKFSPKKISLELSKIKAKSISKNKKNILVIGADTVIDYKGVLLDKANNMKDAKKKIKKLSGKNHTIISSIAAYYNSKLVWSKSEKTIVKIRKLKDKEIDSYLKNTGPKIINSVGCYFVEKNGALIIEDIKGDFFNIMGFPLFSFLRFLKNPNLKNPNLKNLTKHI